MDISKILCCQRQYLTTQQNGKEWFVRVKPIETPSAVLEDIISTLGDAGFSKSLKGNYLEFRGTYQPTDAKPEEANLPDRERPLWSHRGL